MISQEMIEAAQLAYIEAIKQPGISYSQAIAAALSAALAKSRDEEREQSYRAMLRAIMLRQGGSLYIQPEEMPEHSYTIIWRPTSNGGLEAKLEDGKVKQ